MDLYFKPYPCCRWAHPAIDACVDTMKKNNIILQDIAHVTIKTFKRATLLSKIEPKTADEAQYNIAYPVASSLVYGDFGIEQVQTDNLNDEKTLAMMKKLSFEVDETFDSKFPEHRICRAEILTNDNKLYVSDECEPRGESCENIGIDWLSDKFKRITAPFISKNNQEEIIDLISSDEDMPIRTIVEKINSALL